MASNIKKTSPSSISVKLQHLGLLQGLMDADNLSSIVNSMIGKNGAHIHIQSGQLTELFILRYLNTDMTGGFNSIEEFARKLPANLFALSNTCVENPYLHANRYSVADIFDRIAAYGPKRFSTEILSSLIKADSTIVNRPHATSNTSIETIDTADLPYQAALNANNNDNTMFLKFFAEGELDYLKQPYSNIKTLVAETVLADAKTVKACHDCGIELVARLNDTKVMNDFEKVQSGLTHLSSVQVPSHSWVKKGTPHRSMGYAWLGKQKLIAEDGKSVDVLKIIFTQESLRQIKTESIRRSAEKELKEIERKLVKLVKVPRSCKADAQHDFENIAKDLKYVTLSEIEYEDVMGYATAGRPKPNAKKILTGVKVHAKATINEDSVNAAIEHELYYVLATTNVDTKQTQENAISLYKTYNYESDNVYQWIDIKAKGKLYDSIFFRSESRTRAFLALEAIAQYYARKLIIFVERALNENALSMHKAK